MLLGHIFPLSLASIDPAKMKEGPVTCSQVLGDGVMAGCGPSSVSQAQQGAGLHNRKDGRAALINIFHP